MEPNHWARDDLVLNGERCTGMVLQHDWNDVGEPHIQENIASRFCDMSFRERI